MASYYGVLFEEFWTGKTGRNIRRAGGERAQVLALYLISNRHANMLGLYPLAFEDLAHETGLKPTAARKALQVLSTANFAHYDEASEFVWVVNMFRFRLGLKVGQALDADDKRALGANRLFHRLAENPFKARFFSAVGPLLHLTAEPPVQPATKRADSEERGGTTQAPPQDDGRGFAGPPRTRSEGASEQGEGASKDLTSQINRSPDHQGSEISDQGTHTDRASAREVLGARLMGNEHRAHAACGRICVPAFLHRQFKDALGGDEEAADIKLRAWYLATLDSLPETDVLPTEAAKFWRPRFDAAFVTLPAPAPLRPVPSGRTGAAPAGKYAAVTGGLS